MVLATATEYRQLLRQHHTEYARHPELLYTLVTDLNLPNSPDKFESSLGKVADLILPVFIDSDKVRASASLDDRHFVILDTGEIYLLPSKSEQHPKLTNWNEVEDIERVERDGYELLDITLPENSPLCLLLKKGDQYALAVVLDEKQMEEWTCGVTPASIKRLKQEHRRRQSRNEKKSPASRRLDFGKPPDNSFRKGLAISMILCTLLFAIALAKGWIRFSIENKPLTR